MISVVVPQRARDGQVMFHKLVEVPRKFKYDRASVLHDRRVGMFIGREDAKLDAERLQAATAVELNFHAVIGARKTERIERIVPHSIPIDGGELSQPPNRFLERVGIEKRRGVIARRKGPGSRWIAQIPPRAAQLMTRHPHDVAGVKSTAAPTPQSRGSARAILESLASHRIDDVAFIHEAFIQAPFES